ncbi:hypothetical protein SISSUDRAFT_251533 [Sistotremastrum suecicum HHB10207 ss-3]|uniref:F-box domain-containing protein n=1 Tax=Sistotremastrum suecicum HHB10207 ss-3 TaxID=1314776 RepID=A0A165ZVI7_9AGAM|nr:hypothetical protein SISSUDRAFT_251533 [Sistotremastrum suecicum HHB10207 ss-3]
MSSEHRLDLLSSGSGSLGSKARFRDIPQEIVCYILHGESIYDIVSLAQTSGRFYRLIKADRLVWQNSHDKLMLPLPTGHLLASIPVEDLFRIALRASSLHKAFQQTVTEPKRVVSIGNPDHRSTYHVPGGRWILYERQSQLRFRDMDKIPIQEGVLCDTQSTWEMQIEALGEGNVRCIELSPYQGILFSDNTTYVRDVQFPQGTEPPRYTPRFTSELASIKKIMKCVFDARDSCLLGLHRNLYSIVFLDLKRRLGAVLDLGFGPLNVRSDENI